ncbi:MAG: hypothetical protein IJT21_09620 [Synergistaceae bacterium]|nr:hypothetical protein [Synergistaceae bacterium]
MRETTRTHKNKRKARRRFINFLVILLIFMGVIFSFADIGGNMILSLARNYLFEKYNLSLYTQGITGNPFKGYTLKDFELRNNDGRKVFSAQKLTGNLIFSTLLRGKIKPSEISIDGVNMNLDSLFDSLGKFSDLSQNLIPPKINIFHSKFNSRLGVINVQSLRADLEKFDIDIDAAINNIPVKGVIDFNESAGFNAINRSDISLGSGKFFATGGLLDNKTVDLHASIQDFDLSEIDLLFPALSEMGSFEGVTNLNIDITGDKENLKLSGSLDYIGKKIYGLIVERVSANLAYSENVLTINDLQASAFNVPIQGEIAIASRPNEKISLMIKLDASETNLDVPDMKELSGKIEAFNANITGNPDSLSGVINFSAPKIVYDDKNFANIKTQIKFSNTDSANLNGKFIIDGAQGYLQGKIESFLIKPVLKLTAKIVDLDINRAADFIPYEYESDYKLAGKINLSANITGSAWRPVIAGSLSSQEISAANHKLIKPALHFSCRNDKLTLSRSEGTINGMNINLTGIIEPITSADPKLNLNAALTMTPEQLKNFVPEINKYSLKGNINAGAKISGTINNPVMSLLVFSPNLHAMDSIHARNIELTQIDGKINVHAKSLTAGGLTLSGLNAEINNDDGKINLLANSKSAIFQGLNLGQFNAKISGTPENLTLDDVRTGTKGAEIIFSGSMQVYPAVKLNLALNSQNFRLERITQNLSGGANLAFNLSGTGKNITGKGSINADTINFYEVGLNDVNLPLNYSDGKLSSNGTFEIYNGTAKNALNLDVNAQKFTDNISASGLDLNLLLNDLIGTLDGKISSSAKLIMRISGDNKNFSGTGNFSAGEGIITGFDWLSLVNKSDGLKFSGINAPLLLQAGKLIIKTGSAINPNKHETLYKYAKLIHDGIINFTGQDVIIDLIAEMGINAKFVNVIDLLRDGAKDSGDFRPVTLRISGSADSLDLSAGDKNLQADSDNMREKFKDELRERARDEIRKGLKLGLGGLLE